MSRSGRQRWWSGRDILASRGGADARAVRSIDGVTRWTAGAGETLPAEATAVRWNGGTVECRFRLLHPAGSLVAPDGETGEILTDPRAECTTCSDACAG